MSVHFADLCFISATGAGCLDDAIRVALCCLIATIGSHAGLEMAERWRGASGAGARIWLIGSAVTLGGSLWTMQFMGLLAARVRLPIGYDPIATVASLGIAVAMVGLGLWIGRGGALSVGRMAVAGLVVGLGVAATHKVGLAAMPLPGHLAHHPGLWSLSLLIAVAAAFVALWLSLTARGTWRRGLAALIMAVVLCGMHYTAVAGTEGLVDPSVTSASGRAAGPLAAAVAAAALALLGLAIICAMVDRRLFAAAGHEAEALRAANTKLEAMQMEIVRRLCRAGEFRDTDTGEHVDRIGLMAHRLALAAGCSAGVADDLLKAAPLHDIGKIGISDVILLKPGRLTASERDAMEKHATIGHTILAGSGIRLLDLAAEIARDHHERWDGTGYPARLAGEAIPLASRIVAIVDVFDALMSRRPYKEPWPLEEIAGHIRAEAGRHFDPRLVDAFLADLPGMLAISQRHASAWPRPAAAASNQADDPGAVTRPPAAPAASNVVALRPV
jgi:putative two-component system response regulator